MLLLALFTTLLPVSSVFATRHVQVVLSLPALQGPESPQVLEKFLDEFWNEHAKEAHVPGLAFVMVKGGNMFLCKSYGIANMANAAPMTSQTALRVGSVSTVVTATAIMQLVERGRIDLDAPITRYLPDFDLNDSYAEPSTVRQLLTHTAGYNDTILQTHASTQEGWLPLADFLAAKLPPRALPPGQVLSYSSWDYALLGLIIEHVSGMPYEQFIEEQIFQPLHMTHSTFAQPLPFHIAKKLAVGYQYTQKTYKAIPYDFAKLSPGASLVSTSENLAVFMLALLQRGRSGNIRILQPETVQTMLQRQATHHPLLRGNAYGLVEVFPNNYRILRQDGDGSGFTSRFILMPEHIQGIFISVNAPVYSGPGVLSTQTQFIRQLSDTLFDQFYPSSKESSKVPNPLPPLPDAKTRAKRYVGHYCVAHYSRRTFFKLEALFNQIAVQDNEDGTLQIDKQQYVEIAPLLFQRVDDSERYVTFRENKEGSISYLLFGGTESYEKVAWYKSRPFQFGLVGILLLFFLSAVAGWPLASLFFSITPVSLRIGRWIAALVSLLNLIFLVGFSISVFQKNFFLFYTMLPRGVRAFLIIPQFNSLLTLCLPVFAAMIWKNRDGSMVERIHYTFVMIAALIFIPFLMYWNLWGFRF